ncbi:winged helix-turn-helix transcriptional regulator [Methylobacterium sp. SI9]|uniref:winged helix-turn-helix transcriptional regulator n=1 Tax=Methylobacterium guangdongense TaxID=3138811 RepID=UPI00313D488A
MDVAGSGLPLRQRHAIYPLRRAQTGITHKAHTQFLRRLEANGLVKRSIASTTPVAVT